MASSVRIRNWMLGLTTSTDDWRRRKRFVVSSFEPRASSCESPIYSVVRVCPLRSLKVESSSRKRQRDGVEIPRRLFLKEAALRISAAGSQSPPYGGSFTPANRLDLSVILPRGFHPFPSRTRKLSPAGPMVLHAKVCGRVGSCRHK